MEIALAQELAKLSLAIQDGRRAFNELQAEKEAYLQEREGEALKRVQQALDNATAAIKQTDDYVKLIKKVSTAAISVISEVTVAKVALRAERERLKDETKIINEQLDTKNLELAAAMQGLNLERQRIEGLGLALGMRKDELDRQEVSVDHKRNMLSVAIKVAKQHGLWQTVQEMKIGE